MSSTPIFAITDSGGLWLDPSAAFVEHWTPAGLAYAETYGKAPPEVGDPNRLPGQFYAADRFVIKSFKLQPSAANFRAIADYLDSIGCP